MKTMTSPSAASISSRTAFSRSSNSPLYFAPATKAPISNESRVLSARASGTSLFTILCARPSAIAVLPTPGAPISTGLFLVRRARICMVRRTSSSRPMTGSRLPCKARAVRSVAYFDRLSIISSPTSLSIVRPFRMPVMARSSVSISNPASRNSLAAFASD